MTVCLCSRSPCLDSSLLPRPRSNRRLSLGTCFWSRFFSYAIVQQVYRGFRTRPANAGVDLFGASWCVGHIAVRFLLIVVQDPVSRVRNVPDPIKEPLRSFQQQHVRPLSFACLATKSQSLGTDTLRRVRIYGHSSIALHCCTY